MGSTDAPAKVKIAGAEDRWQKTAQPPAALSYEQWIAEK
jgi:hypothetical protein